MEYFVRNAGESPTWKEPRGSGQRLGGYTGRLGDFELRTHLKLSSGVRDSWPRPPPTADHLRCDGAYAPRDHRPRDRG